MLANPFKRRWYLIYTKPAAIGAIRNSSKAHAVCVLYRRRRSDVKGKKFFIDHSLNSNHLVSWFKAQWWLFLIRIYGKNNGKLFAYKKPVGRVYLKSIKF